jgi:two-component system, NarL family, sensor kinase
MRTFIKLSKLSLIFLMWFSVQAQSNIDSIKVFAQTDSSDSARALTMVKLGMYYAFSDPEEAAIWLEKARTLSSKKGLDYARCNFLYVYGVFQDVAVDQPDSAVIYFEEGLACSKSSKFIDMELKCLNALGLIHRNIGLHPKALEYFYACKEANDTAPENFQLSPSVLLNNIGLVEMDMFLYEKAIVSHEKALKLREANPRLADQVPVSLMNLAICYRHLQAEEKSETLFLRAKKLFKEQNNHYQYIKLLSNLANLYASSNRHQAAFACHQEILNFNEDGYIVPNNQKLLSKSAAAGALIQLGRPEEALQNAEDALRLIKNNPDLEFYSASAYFNASLAYFMNGQPEKGLAYQIVYEEMLADRLNEDFNEKLAEWETKYETDKKESEIRLLKAETALLAEKQRRNSYLYFGIIGFLILVGVVIFSWQRQQKQLQDLQAEQAIQNAMFLSEQQERARIARDLHDSLGQKLAVQHMMLDGLQNKVSIENIEAWEHIRDLHNKTMHELRTISHNMIPEELNLGLVHAIKTTVNQANNQNDLQIKLDFETPDSDIPDLTENKKLTLYRIFQEVLANMIKHAGATQILIKLNGDAENLLLFMQDNGMGFNQKDLKESKGIGWRNIAARVSLLKGKINIISNLNQGTRISIAIPITQ